MTPDEAEAIAPTVTSDARDSRASQPPRDVDTTERPMTAGGFEDRYQQGKLLGRGGMGEVQLYQDERIGRDVALKRLRDGAAANPDATARFLREARVQGQLEHPAIVPVYDLGIGPDGAPYFTMKRLRGDTLKELLAASETPRAKLLSAFSRVCQAVELAHARGVLHRDLKPANIMLGDFGEVYVLDWGVARVSAEATAETNASSHPSSGTDTGSGSTVAGQVMGTPGYMAPEQLRGEIDRTDERADQYALGAVLFELLTRRPLHERTSADSIVDSTLAGADARACELFPDAEVAPELEAICVRATATDPDDRYPSVRAMREELDRFLEGDRDMARRRELAERHAADADRHVTRALAHGDVDARKQALADAGRALALDPENARALHILGRLMLEPPREMPAEVDALLRERYQQGSRAEARAGVYMHIAYGSFAPFLVWMGVKDWLMFGLLGAVLVAQGLHAYLISRAGRIVTPRAVMAAQIGNTALLILSSRMFGPFILIPALTIVTTIAFLFHERIQKPSVTIAIGTLPVIIPAILEATGIWAASYHVTDGGIVLDSQLVHTPPTLTFAMLAVTTVASIVIAAGMIHGLRRSQIEAERQLQLQAWQLRQLVPANARPERPREQP